MRGSRESPALGVRGAPGGKKGARGGSSRAILRRLLQHCDEQLRHPKVSLESLRFDLCFREGSPLFPLHPHSLTVQQGTR